MKAILFKEFRSFFGSPIGYLVIAIFNEAGFLEIAIFRSNPMNLGSASSLLGLGYRDVITINFLNN